MCLHFLVKSVWGRFDSEGGRRVRLTDRRGVCGGGGRRSGQGRDSRKWTGRCRRNPDIARRPLNSQSTRTPPCALAETEGEKQATARHSDGLCNRGEPGPQLQVTWLAPLPFTTRTWRVKVRDEVSRCKKDAWHMNGAMCEKNRQLRACGVMWCQIAAIFGTIVPSLYVLQIKSDFTIPLAASVVFEGIHLYVHEVSICNRAICCSCCESIIPVQSPKWSLPANPFCRQAAKTRLMANMAAILFFPHSNRSDSNS